VSELYINWIKNRLKMGPKVGLGIEEGVGNGFGYLI